MMMERGEVCVPASHWNFAARNVEAEADEEEEERSVGEFLPEVGSREACRS